MDKVVTDTPFVWNVEKSSSYHHCLVARVVTAKHPNPIPKNIRNMQQLATYVSGHPDVALRNVAVVNKEVPTFSETVDYQHGDLEEDAVFLLTCKACPIGSEVAFSCETSGPNPPIAVSKTKITDSTSQVLGIRSKVPAGFESKITFSYWANGGKPGKGFSIALSANYPVSMEDDAMVDFETTSVQRFVLIILPSS